MKIHEIIARGAVQHAQRTALIHGANQVTYSELDALSDTVAQSLRERDLSQGHGFLFLPNSIEYIVAYFAVTKSEGVVAPTPISLPQDRLAGEMAYCDATYAITDTAHADAVYQAAQKSGTVRSVIILHAAGRGLEVKTVPVQNTSVSTNAALAADDLAVLISTSGTASDPKRVMLSHTNLISNIRSFDKIAKLSSDDIGAIVLPMTAVGTNTTELLTYLSAGMTINIFKGIFVLGTFCKMLERQQVSVINVTPFILSTMLDHQKEVASKIASVKKIFFASAPFAVEPFRQLITAFPGTGFYYGYGLTEASPRCTTLTPNHHSKKLESSGTTLEDVELAIVDESGHILPPGEIGEIIVRGPNVMLGYYKKQDETDRVLQNGWLYTGDCGSQDEDGFLYIRGRKKNIIITRGISVSPEEVEQELMGCPDICEAYVAGCHDERLGESIVAYVVPRGKTKPDQGRLKEYLRHRLDPAKIPARIEFVSHLQRNHNMKLIRG